MNLKAIFTKIISVCNLKKKFNEVLGVYFNSEKVFCVRLELISSEKQLVNQWKIIDIAETSITGEQQLNINIAELIAEKTAELCKNNKWSSDAVAFCLNIEDVVTHFEDLSNIPKDKISNTVHYQIAEEGNFEIDNCLSSFMEIDFGVWMEGILKSDVVKWVAAFQKYGLNLIELTAMPSDIEKVYGVALGDVNIDFFNSGGLNALFAAKNLAYQTDTNFLKEKTAELNGWNFSRIIAGIFLLTFILTGTIQAVDFWHNKLIEEDIVTVKERLALLENDRKKEEFIEKDLTKLKNKNQILSTLSEGSFPWRSLLIHFGTLKIKDVWITELRALDNNKIELKGEAVSFELMANYVKLLENDKDIFKNVTVKSSETKQDSQKRTLVYFVIELIF